MPDRDLPANAVMSAAIHLLPAGSTLWRCHSARFTAHAFNRTPWGSPFGGGRFDGTKDDPYPFLYAAPERTTALAEVLLRDLPFGEPADARLVPEAAWGGRALSRIRTTRDLSLISLVTQEDLAGVLQDGWLVETAQFAKTRYWAAEMRRRVPQAQGLLWQSKRHRPRQVLVLFGDRCGDDPVETVHGGGFALFTPEGMADANRILAPLRAVLSGPSVEP